MAAVAGAMRAAVTAGHTLQCGRQQGRCSSSLAGRQLRRAASNGSRCRAFFKFGNKDKEATKSGVSMDLEYFKGQSRSDFLDSDVQDYFMYMGMLAHEGTYDRCEAMLASGTAPVDLLLLMACQENDDGKVEEVLAAGADPTVKDLDGRSGGELTTKDEIREMLAKAQVAA